jgi:hypothetical protein
VTSPLDDVIDAVKRKGYLNQRQTEHSNLLSEGILRDLRASCPRIQADLHNGTVKAWMDRHIPAPRGNRDTGREADLLIGPPVPGEDKPAPSFRVCIEHKAVFTAHRNVRARFGDLNEVLEVVHEGRPDAVLVGTVLIGVSPRFLNVADRIKRFIPDWEKSVLPRLSTGDQTLWADYPHAISENQEGDPGRTLAVLQELGRRDFRRTHLKGYDFLLYVPVDIDNVNPPKLARKNSLGIDIDQDYLTMIRTICEAYSARWPAESGPRPSAPPTVRTGVVS